MRMFKSKLYVYYNNTLHPYCHLNSALNFDSSDDFFLGVAGNGFSKLMGNCVLLVAGGFVQTISGWGSWTDCSSSSVNVVK